MEFPHEITVSYQLSERDIKTFIARAYSKMGISVSLLPHLFTWMILLPFAPFVPFLVEGDILRRQVIFGFGTMLVIGALMAFRIRRHLQRVAINWVETTEARRFMQATTVFVSPLGVQSKTPLTDGWYAWSIISEIERGREFAYFWIGKSEAIIVPMRAFADEASFMRFVACAEAYKKADTGMVLECPRCKYDLRACRIQGCPECGWRREGANTSHGRRT